MKIAALLAATVLLWAMPFCVGTARSATEEAEQGEPAIVRNWIGRVIGPKALYDGEIPNSKSSVDREMTADWHGMETISRVSRPTYTVYLPPRSRASGAAVLIFPGGGYQWLTWDMEGRWIAQALQDRGIAAILVKYRLPSDETMMDKSIGPLQDAQQAILQVRRHASSWGLDPRRVGALGFSAGGHLASNLGTLFATALVPNPDRISLRPDFLILVYAITNFAVDRVNSDVRTSLVGEHPSPDLITKLSSALQITDRTPPTLLLAASDDQGVKYDHAVEFYCALRKHNVPAELVLFDRGEHGFFEINRDEWRAPMWAWLQRNGFLGR